jgi:hypothetical protein
VNQPSPEQERLARELDEIVINAHYLAFDLIELGRNERFLMREESAFIGDLVKSWALKVRERSRAGQRLFIDPPSSIN